nr:MAG TPA: minor tail protein [Caudoviricetes sp.]
MADRIKGITIEIGGDTTGLSKALSGVNKEIKDTQTQLKDVNRLLKMDPGNTELLRQKYDLLNKSIDSTEKKLDTLKQAEKQVQDQFKSGKVSENQYNALKREVIATESTLKNLKSEAQKTDNAIRGIDEKPVEEVASAADKAETSLKDAGKEASNFGDYLKAGAIVEGSKAIISGMKDIADESREYMKIMGSLEISSQAAGYTAEQTASSYKTLYGVLGDDQTAATTTANLQALGLSQSQLDQIINGTIGAWATYGDSIPIDSLSEAINETVKTGNVTGTFADVLNWAGTSEDEFNAKLQAANSESERANLVLQELANQGLMTAGQAWQENNEALFESNQANADLQEQLSELGEMIMPIITTVTQGVANILSWLTNLSPEVKNIIGLVATVITTIAGVAAIIQGITAAQAALNAVMNANPISLIIMAIAALVAAFIYLWNNCEEFREFWINLWDTISSAFSAVWDAIVNFFTVTIPDAWNSVVDFFWQGYYTWQSIWQSIGDFFSGIWDGIVSFFTETIPNAWNSLVDFCWQGYYAWQEVWQNVGDFFSGIWDGIVGFFTETIPNAWNGLMDIFNKIGSWWSGIWNGVRDTFSNVFNSLVNIAKQPINAIIGLINGIIDGLNWMIGGLNQLSFDIPDWVPIFGGKKFGINIPTIGKIPYLASGGVLSQGSAVVGEAGPELLTMMGTKAVVQPLTSSTTTNTNLGGVNIVVYGAPGQDVRELADIIMDEMQSATMRKGAVWG